MTGTWSSGAFFFTVDFFFSTNHANLPSVPSGINSRFQFHAVHFPFPKAQVSGQKGRKLLWKEEIWHPTRETDKSKYHRVDSINIPIVPHDQRQRQEETNSFRGDGILLDTRNQNKRYLWGYDLFMMTLSISKRNCLIQKHYCKAPRKVEQAFPGV